MPPSLKSTRWFGRSDSPEWVMDGDGVLLGYRDEKGIVHRIPNSVSPGSVTDQSPIQEALASRIVGAHKIRRMLSAIAQASFRRVNLGLHSHSIGVGVDATSNGAYAAAEFTAWHSRSAAAVMAKVLSAATGGVACSASIAAGGTGGVKNPLLTSAGGTVRVASEALFGPQGWMFFLGNGDTIKFKSVGTYVRVYGVGSGVPTPVQPLYSAPSIAGGADQTVPSPPAAPIPANNRTWYDFTIGPVAPEEEITLKGVAAGSYIGYFIDLDYRPNTPGVTVHRLCQPGASLSALHAASIDNTDTAGTNLWLGAGAANTRLGQAQSMSVRVPQDAVITWTDVNDLNDYIDRGFSLADMQRHLRNYLAYQASLNLDVLAVFGPIRDPAFNAGSRPYNQDDLIEAYIDVIDSMPGVAYIDLTKEWPGSTIQERWTSQVASGLMEPAPTIVHPGAVGHPYWGSLIGNALLQASYAGRR